MGSDASDVFLLEIECCIWASDWDISFSNCQKVNKALKKWFQNVGGLNVFFIWSALCYSAAHWKSREINPEGGSESLLLSGSAFPKEISISNVSLVLFHHL